MIVADLDWSEIDRCALLPLNINTCSTSQTPTYLSIGGRPEGHMAETLSRLLAVLQSKARITYALAVRVTM